MKLPLLISNPHAGLRVPPEAAPYCRLTKEQIAKDGDEGAAGIYAIADHVQAFMTTDVARAVVDLNRATDDRRADGIVKTHTCWNEQVYHRPLPESVIADLLNKYYHPYHRELTGLAERVVLGIDCHTMAAHGPPIGPDPGRERPAICLSNADGTCSEETISLLAGCLRQSFDVEVAINSPFRGGFIIRAHSAELPWVQLELSRAPFLSIEEKQARLLEALTQWTAACGLAPRTLPSKENQT